MLLSFIINYFINERQKYWMRMKSEMYNIVPACWQYQEYNGRVEHHTIFNQGERHTFCPKLMAHSFLLVLLLNA